MAADLLGAEARHQPDGETAHCRRCYHQPAGFGASEARQLGADCLKPDEVGNERNGPQQDPGRGNAADPDHAGHGHQNQDTPIGGEIP